jgi:hypothetical protein
VRCQKTGQSVTYSIADRRVEEIITTLRRNYCTQNPDARIPQSVAADK